MNNQLSYTEQLEHRIAILEKEVSRLIEYIDDNRLMESLDKPTKYSKSAWTHVLNMEVACDLENKDSLYWIASN